MAGGNYSYNHLPGYQLHTKERETTLLRLLNIGTFFLMAYSGVISPPPTHTHYKRPERNSLDSVDYRVFVTVNMAISVKDVTMAD